MINVFIATSSAARQLGEACSVAESSACGRDNVVTRSVRPRSSIEDSFLVIYSGHSTKKKCQFLTQRPTVTELMNVELTRNGCWIFVAFYFGRFGE